MSMMRRADGTGRLPRVLSIVVLAILLLLVASVGHTILTITTEPSIEERAHSEAVRRAALVGDALVHGVADGATELGQSAARNDRVDVLTVDGTDRRHSPGVRVVFRVHVTMSQPVMAGRASTEMRVCFRQVLDQERRDFSRTQVPCPETAPPDGTSTPVPSRSPTPPPPVLGPPTTVPGAPAGSSPAPAR
ncbi:hypothetical protein [Plantactinospora soyae]|uniref:Uncharacterized protein n=1 Tax=Plantactinospora soyae TaxID=1544732 RepID=A0A927MDF9_9ACTN|nr:hypothetical protein [Plantactinospora soyae]MBE1492577.1 hypothetical protein [Plantactinospora soyae]